MSEGSSTQEQETLFSKIVQGKLPANKLYQDERITIFHDKYPQARVHLLAVPNQVIPSLNETRESDESLLGHLLYCLTVEAKKLGLGERGYRVLINCGREGGQEIPHLHLHLLGGEPVGPMRCRHA